MSKAAKSSATTRRTAIPTSTIPAASLDIFLSHKLTCTKVISNAPPTFRSPAATHALTLPLQSSPAQTFTLSAVIFTGAPAFSRTDLLTVTGLHTRIPTTQAALEAAVQHLSDTGLFADIRYASSPQGLVFTLKPMPDDNLLHVFFANFVFWSPQQLDALLKARVPLYTGRIPIAGNLQACLSAALQSLLAEKSVTGAETSATPRSPHPGDSPTAIDFRIASPRVNVHSLTIQPTSPAMQPQIEAVIQSVVGKPYEDGTTRNEVASQLSTLYRDQGYLDIALVSFTNAIPVVTTQAIEVDLGATIEKGTPYRLSTFTYPGSSIFSAEDFLKSTRLQPEDVAAQSAVRASLFPIARAYNAKGFQDVRVSAPATIDRATHHVAYTVTVTPGVQYLVRTIKALGLTDLQRKEFDRTWTMHPGDFYDIMYVNTFLKNNTSLKSLEGHSATYKAICDPNDHLVDLTIIFVKGGTLTQ